MAGFFRRELWYCDVWNDHCQSPSYFTKLPCRSLFCPVIEWPLHTWVFCQTLRILWKLQCEKELHQTKKRYTVFCSKPKEKQTKGFYWCGYGLRWFGLVKRKLMAIWLKRWWLWVRTWSYMSCYHTEGEVTTRVERHCSLYAAHYIKHSQNCLHTHT